MIPSAQRIVLAVALTLAAGRLGAQQKPVTGAAATPTVAEAQRFMTRAEKELADLSVKANRADWVANNFITDDTEELTAEAQEA